MVCDRCCADRARRCAATKLALAQLPKRLRRGRQTLIRTDSGGSNHEFVTCLAQRGRWLSYSVGMTITDAIHQAVLKVPASAWTPAVEPDGDIRDGAWAAELAGDCLTGWPKGLRLSKERSHPGANCASPTPTVCVTCFATNTASEAIATLELRHRQRVVSRAASAPPAPPACAISPLHDAAQNQTWLEIVQIALDLPVWMPCSPGPAPHGSGSPVTCDFGCSPPPPSPSPPAAASASPSTDPGPMRSPTPCTSSTPSRTPG
ncbi:hypothetical protein CTZ27_10275 [Streptomyces griseocarneus]|nr:hypothetical protein CTZ27_10275 [Streptomyces griseocarneus]